MWISEDEWNAAREKLLAEEKPLMKAKDRLVAKRRLLPVTEVDRNWRQRRLGPEVPNALGQVSPMESLETIRLSWLN
ncbi:DUF899 domain-containing protein (plasmid) [Phyllobacterium sp. A18/5-2]|uniref:DUF899 domain-containing protein n=1 Tax=Phyllobacterium sp. A18/5-2 TaxID=2978392 RepID=UPI0021C6A14C|nr:DUF899 domain-containing protein [Phyllobacterium sp. A18/5-2]UXN66311.1 DUF899 domain-containing protein [Phyllobacterium sp. A18/5-2]